jgi:hypothetical protein
MNKFENSKILYEKLYGIKCKKLALVMYYLGKIHRIKYELDEAHRNFIMSLNIYTDQFNLNLDEVILKVNYFLL